VSHLAKAIAAEAAALSAERARMNDRPVVAHETDSRAAHVTIAAAASRVLAQTRAPAHAVERAQVTLAAAAPRTLAVAVTTLEPTLKGLAAAVPQAHGRKNAYSQLSKPAKFAAVAGTVPMRASSAA
jgi:hypothetical protein